MTDDRSPAPPPDPSAAGGPPDGEASSSPAAGGPSLGQIVVGSFLVLIGIGWFLEAADVADVPWRALLPAVLILLGGALAVGSRTARHGGIIALGVVLTVAVAAASAVEVLIDIPISGGVGESREVVSGPIEDEYRHALGTMTVDLRSADPVPAGQTVEISVAVGELIVIVPEDAALDVDARTGIGEVLLFGRQASGLGSDLEYLTPDTEQPVLRLDVDVAIGRLEVRR